MFNCSAVTKQLVKAPQPFLRGSKRSTSLDEEGTFNLFGITFEQLLSRRNVAHLDPTLVTGKRMRYSKSLPARQEIVANWPDIRVPVARFMPVEFKTWEEFDAAFAEYEPKNLVHLRKRSSLSIGPFNKAQ
jgi:hypothetical protein